ncbi:MAG TPA: DoxX family protein [Candidatus Binatia bacterium]|jgi:putative oxidoreductase|nr:DoxX family protein [Candidatus Binatia bacterium]
MERYLGSYASQLYSIMRIIVGLLFACHGAQKLFGLFGGVGGAAAPLFSLMGMAGVIEFFGGLLVAVGLLTGYVAFLASGEMIFAYFMGHFPNGFWPIENTGELAVLYCFIFLYMASMGSGTLSVDAALGKKSRLR